MFGEESRSDCLGELEIGCERKPIGKGSNGRTDEDRSEIETNQNADIPSESQATSDRCGGSQRWLSSACEFKTQR